MPQFARRPFRNPLKLVLRHFFNIRRKTELAPPPVDPIAFVHQSEIADPNR